MDGVIVLRDLKSKVGRGRMEDISGACGIGDRNER